MRSSKALTNAAFLTLIAFGVSETGTAQVSAAPASEQAPDISDSTSLEEVVVTAERRSESVMKTSIAVAVLSGDEVRAKQIHETADLQNYTPALSVTNNGLTNNVNIRGIGLNATTPAVVSGVAIYRDNLFQAPIIAGEPYYDLGNVQVLRGPQGTFVGSNSTGGAMFISSADPAIDDVAHGYVLGQLGNFREADIQGAVNVPLSETLATRFAFNVETRDTAWDNRSPNPESLDPLPMQPGDKNLAAARLGVLWKPSDDLQVVSKFEFYQNKTEGWATKPIPGTTFAPAAPEGDFELAYSTKNTRYDEDLTRGSVEVRYKLGESGITLRSVTGATFYSYNLIYDQDGSPIPSVQQDNTVDEYLASQEFNLISPDDARVRWVAGLYAFYDPVDVRAVNSVYAPDGTQIQSIRIDYINAKYSYAGFAGLRFNVTDDLELQVGGRYTKNRVENDEDAAVDVFLTASPPGPPGTSLTSPLAVAHIPLTGEQEDDDFTWKVAANWNLDDHNFLYAFVATGSKAGGINGPDDTFAPESVTDFEAGWKSSFLDGRVRLQLGGFYNDYTDLQVQVLDPVTTQNTIQNAGSATIWGSEFELTGEVGPWSWNATASYVDSSLDISGIVDTTLLPAPPAALGPQCPPGETTNCFDYTPYMVSLTGQPLPYAPETTFSIGVAYRFGMDGDAGFTPRVDVTRNSVQTSTLFGHEIDLLPERTLVNLRATYAREKWSAELYANNITDEVYPNGRIQDMWSYGMPRQYGVRFSMTF